MRKEKKLQPKATQGMMVGYCEGSSTLYRIWDPAARKVITSRDVIFEEGSTFESPTATVELDYYSIFPQQPVEIGTDMNAELPGDQAEGEAGDPDPVRINANQRINDPQEEDDDGSDDEQLYDDPFHGFENHPHHVPPSTAQLRRSKRIQKQTEKLQPGRSDQAHQATNKAAHPPPKTYGKQALSLQEALYHRKKETYGKRL